jgi:hypothetical protein
LNLLFIPAVIAIVFSSVVAIVWLEARRKERQAFYYSEMVKKIGETSDTAAVGFLRETERIKRSRIREGMTIAGLVGSLAALGLMIFLHAIVTGVPVYLVALIPMLSCVGLLIYARFMSPRE